MINYLPFVHLFELFGGISSAFVGVAEIRQLSGQKLGTKFKVVTDSIKTELLPDFMYVSQALKVIKSSSSILPQTIQDQIAKKQVSIDEITAWKNKIEKLYNEENEKEKLIKIIYSFCVIAFLFCITMMFFVAACADNNNILEPLKIGRYVTYLEVFLVFILFSFFVFIPQDQFSNTGCFTTSAFAFAIALFLSIFLSSNWFQGFSNSFKHYGIFLPFRMLKHFFDNGYVQVYTTLLIALCPVIAILFRVFILWSWRLERFKIQKPKNLIIIKEIKEFFGFLVDYFVKP